MVLELQMSDVDAGYGAVRALHSVSINVKAGETVALLGTNGAGKSTLMKCVMGMVRPTTGTITLKLDDKTHDLTKLSTEEIVNLGVAMVPEGRRLFPKLTVEENLLLGAFRAEARREHEQPDQGPHQGGKEAAALLDETRQLARDLERAGARPPEDGLRVAGKYESVEERSTGRERRTELRTWRGGIDASGVRSLLRRQLGRRDGENTEERGHGASECQDRHRSFYPAAWRECMGIEPTQPDVVRSHWF